MQTHCLQSETLQWKIIYAHENVCIDVYRVENNKISK